jgi:hypothetical protein
MDALAGVLLLLVFRVDVLPRAPRALQHLNGRRWDHRGAEEGRERKRKMEAEEEKESREKEGEGED